MAKEPLHITQSSTLPPAQPAYVLRGHAAQIHAVHFFRDNLRLLSGDADGWVVLWDVPIRRPVAVWQAHKGTILGLGSWGEDKIITHGRDNKLQVWQLRQEDEATLSNTLPIEDAISERKKPWLLHSLPVNALNFCSFAMCADQKSTSTASEQGILLGVPGVQDGHINVTFLPDEARVATIPTQRDTKTGMVMAIRLYFHYDELLVLAGYESGHACVWKQDDQTKHWRAIYTHKAHTQPVLSIDIAPSLSSFFTSAADAIIARHPLPSASSSSDAAKVLQTKHAGQQSLTVRSDEKIFATAGWDSRVRVYTTKTMKELAVLKWHKEGCYALAFAHIHDSKSSEATLDHTDAVVKRDLTVSQQRTARAKTTHWLAVGSKDGKISLWDIY